MNFLFRINLNSVIFTTTMSIESRLSALEADKAASLRPNQTPIKNTASDNDFVFIQNTTTGKVERVSKVFFDSTESVININKFGVFGDGLQLSDWSVNGNQISSPSVNFSASDIGKIFSIADAGADNEHLVGYITSIVSDTVATVDIQATTNVSNKLGSYGTENTDKIKDAFDFAMNNNIKLYAPEGVYLIGKANDRGVQFNATKEGANLYLEGAGEGLTIFRDLDGRTQRQGRFTKMFYMYLNNTNNFGNVCFKGFTLDKNGRSLTKSPVTEFNWEQAHCFGLAQFTTTSEKVGGFCFEDIEIYDKIGAGISASSSQYFKKVRFSNITFNVFNGYEGVAQYGQRADIEASMFSDDIKIDKVSINYLQIEPVDQFKTTFEKRRNVTITNSFIEILEYTELGDAENDYHVLSLSNVTSKNFTIRGATLYAVNCDLLIKNLINSVNGSILNSTVRIPYDDTTNTITSLQCEYLLGSPNQPNNFTFEKVKFLIDSNDSNILPTNPLLTSGNFTDAQNASNIITIIGCTFDDRCDIAIDAYGGGIWHIKNNMIGSQSVGVQCGAFSSFKSEVYLNDNDYNNCVFRSVFLRNSNALWVLSIKETINEDDYWNYIFQSSVGNTDIQIKQYPHFILNNIADRTDYHIKGSTARVKHPSAAGYVNYICTASGTTGTYKGYGTLEV